MGIEFLALLAGLVGGVVSALIALKVLKKDGTTYRMEVDLVELALSLFLLAEKQGWAGKDKLSFVVQKVEELFPGELLNKVLNGKDLDTYLQEVYDQVLEKAKK